MKRPKVSHDLLDWFDVHARKLPWRTMPLDRKQGVRPDPYHVWVSEIMLQQTTVAHARPYFERFTTLWSDINAFAKAEPAQIMSEWAGLGYYARARNMLKCAQEVVALGGFPPQADALIKLSGVGPYTSAAIAAIAFDQAVVPVDANVERVISRLFDISTPLPKAKKEITQNAHAVLPAKHSGAFAEALMDLGASICAPKKPSCADCPLISHCEAYKHGTQAERPVKLPKPERPNRFGHVYIIQYQDKIAVKTRPNRGLLGGMKGLPTSDWTDIQRDYCPPLKGCWENFGQYKHIFTHFTLHLCVWHMTYSAADAPKDMHWMHISDKDSLPTAFKKALNSLNKTP